MPINLMIATPAYGGQVHIDYLHSVISFKEIPGVSTVVVTLGNESLITRARNNLFSMFLYSNADYLFFLDADIGFSQQGLQQLLNHRLDIVCAPYRLKNPNAIYLAVTEPIDTSKFPLVEVTHAGTGIMLISRKLAEDVKEYAIKNNMVYKDNMIYAQNSIDNGRQRDIYDVFKAEIDNETNIYLSEDYYFCKLVRSLGYKVYVDYSCPSVHNGVLQFVYHPSMLQTKENESKKD